MLIDSHCHLDAHEFTEDIESVTLQAIQAGVEMIVIPAVAVANFSKVQTLSKCYSHCCYALGIHPMYVDTASPSDLIVLEASVKAALDTGDKLVAIGEIGLDFFITKANEEVQEYFFTEQLKIAKKFNLPVILHVRKSVDQVLKHLRRLHLHGGIAHAFNGSQQQAETFIDLGFKLGFGGAMTHTRAHKIRALAKNLPLSSIVLETDSPDIPPEWLGTKARNSPKELFKIAEVLAEIRGCEVAQIIETTGKNAKEVLPKIADLFTPLKVTH